MPGIVLVPTTEPTDRVRTEQGQVQCRWENQQMGVGTLYITEAFLVWISDSDNRGFTLTYPSIGVYGQTAPTEQDPTSALFMVIDLNKTDIQIATSSNGMNGNAHEDSDEDEQPTGTVRFIPEDSTSLPFLTNLIQECQLLNPDPDDEQSDDFGEHILMQGDIQEMQAGGDIDSRIWYTTETLDDEVRLSEEGRANLERIVGNLTIAPEEQEQMDKPEDHYMEEE